MPFPKNLPIDLSVQLPKLDTHTCFANWHLFRDESLLIRTAVIHADRSEWLQPADFVEKLLAASANFQEVEIYSPESEIRPEIQPNLEEIGKPVLQFYPKRSISEFLTEKTLSRS